MKTIDGTSAMMGAAVFYGVCSISMNFLNKAILSSYSFNFPFYIMSCQMLMTLVILEIMRVFTESSISKFTCTDGRKFLPASLCFLLHTTLSLTALHGMNIPMYAAIKRCTPIVNLLLSVVILRKGYPSSSLLFSIVLITAGCLIASAGDLQFDAYAYIMGGLSCFAQAGYFTLVQRDAEVNKISTLQMLHTNAWNTLPVFILFSVVFGEFFPATAQLFQSSFDFLFLFAILVFSGGILMFSTFLCNSLCSALTTSLVGVVKSFFQTIVGFFTFGGVAYHPLIVTGLMLNLCGGVLYTFTKYKEKTNGDKLGCQVQNLQKKKKEQSSVP